ncbi:MAG: hypothetical protein R3F11_12175 [Verrucomicrobiales bacterium]
MITAYLQRQVARIQEHQPKVRKGKGQVAALENKRLTSVALANPFLLPKTSGVRYANEDLTGGHLSSMLTNAQSASEYITDTHVPKRGGRYLPAVAEILAQEDAQAKTLAARREFSKTISSASARKSTGTGTRRCCRRSSQSPSRRCPNSPRARPTNGRR